MLMMCFMGNMIIIDNFVYNYPWFYSPSNKLQAYTDSTIVAINNNLFHWLIHSLVHCCFRTSGSPGAKTAAPCLQ